MLELTVVLLTAIANAVIALTVFKRNPKSATHRLIAGLSLISALWTVFNYISALPADEATRLFWVRAVMFATTPYGTVIFLLAETFPNPVVQVRRRKLLFLLGFNIITALFAMSPYMFTQLKNLPNGSFELTPGPAMLLYAIAFIGFMTAGFIRLIYKLWKSKGVLRQQLLLFLVGLIASFTLLTLTNFVAVVIFGTIELTSLGPPFTLILVLSMVYAIIRHRFLDISYLVARTVSYTVLLVVTISLYATILFSAVSLLPAVIDRTIVSIVVTLLVGFSFNPLRLLIEKVTDRFLFKQQYDIEEVLNQLTYIMASEIDIHKLAKKLSQKLISKLKVVSAVFIILDEGELSVIGEKNWNQDQQKNAVKLSELLYDSKFPSMLYDQVTDDTKKQLLQSLSVHAAFTLQVKANRIGLLLVGPKASGEIFTSKDEDLLSIFASQAAIALQNAQSYRKIQQFSKVLEKKVIERTTELKQTQARELKKAKELLQLKDEFVFIATHDLGTPVTAIQGYTDLLQMNRKNFDTDTKENIDALQEASERLSQLTADLLQVARSESGAIHLQLDAVDIVQLIKAAITQVKVSASKRKIKVEFDEPKSPVFIHADKEKVAEVLENLLSNAVKYNRESGEIKVKIKKEGATVEVEVADTGIGIPKDKQVLVFDKFFRAQQNGAESVPGTGLGLFLVKVLVEKMKGKIWFESIENKGSTFTFSLPLSKAK